MRNKVRSRYLKYNIRCDLCLGLQRARKLGVLVENLELLLHLNFILPFGQCFWETTFEYHRWGVQVYLTFLYFCFIVLNSFWKLNLHCWINWQESFEIAIRIVVFEYKFMKFLKYQSESFFIPPADSYT